MIAMKAFQVADILAALPIPCLLFCLGTASVAAKMYLTL